MTIADFFSRLRWWPVPLAGAALLACATPEPPPAPTSSPPVRRTVAVAPPAVEMQPVPAPVAPPPAASPPSAAEARFPDPPVDYRTPAFEAGHAGFTSNAELQALLRSLVREPRPGATGVALVELGSSQSGVLLNALLFTRTGETEPAALWHANRPTVLLVGQQHGDEPAGSEALLVVAQELARGRLDALLDRINVVLLPRANPDGAREQQRLTASGIDANRDHLLLRTPEAQAMAQLAREFRPMVVVDLHEYPLAPFDKFGAVPRYDAMVQYAMTGNLPEFVTKASQEWFHRPLVARLKDEGLSSEWYHTTSVDPNDKRVSMGSVQPDSGRNVNGLRNAVSVLIETRGAGLGRLHFKRRVHTQVVAVTSLLHSAAERAADLVKLRAFVDNEVSALACQGETVIDAAATPSEYGLAMIDPHSGMDKTVSVAWDSALELRALKTRARPCGYWLSAEQADAVRRLRALGVLVQRLEELGEMRGEMYRPAAPDAATPPDAPAGLAEGGRVLRPQVQTVPALLDVPAGSFYVPLDQPLANLAIAALEPDTAHSYVAHRIIASVDGEARVLARPLVKVSVVP